MLVKPRVLSSNPTLCKLSMSVVRYNKWTGLGNFANFKLHPINKEETTSLFTKIPYALAFSTLIVSEISLFDFNHRSIMPPKIARVVINFFFTMEVT